MHGILAEYEPSLPAMLVFAAPVLLVNVIVAPGTIAPDSSVIRPRNVAVWPDRADEQNSTIVRANITFMISAA
ncbi:MAG: hypothetical protein DMG14_28605 [Acidobacteria bacterium]|nr:MAG: hypothetical protein DMG14_28605 [Acidobacteriota bacterium]